METLPALQRVSVGVLALICLAVLALGGLLAWRAHAQSAAPDLAGAVLVAATPAPGPAAAA